MHDIERARAAVSQVLTIESCIAEHRNRISLSEHRHQFFDAAVAIYCATLQAEAIGEARARSA